MHTTGPSMDLSTANDKLKGPPPPQLQPSTTRTGPAPQEPLNAQLRDLRSSTRPKRGAATATALAENTPSTFIDSAASTQRPGIDNKDTTTLAFGLPSPDSVNSPPKTVAPTRLDFPLDTDAAIADHPRPPAQNQGNETTTKTTKQPKRRGRPPKNPTKKPVTKAAKQEIAPKDPYSLPRSANKPSSSSSSAEDSAASAHSSAVGPSEPSTKARKTSSWSSQEARTSASTLVNSDDAMNIDAASDPDLDADPKSDDKKDRLRARNRAAAQKCRIRKQRGVQDLQAQEAAVEACNHALSAEVASLRGEVLMLKNMVLQHGGCGCSFIENYIEGAAQSLVKQGAEGNGQDAAVEGDPAFGAPPTVETGSAAGSTPPMERDWGQPGYYSFGDAAGGDQKFTPDQDEPRTTGLASQLGHDEERRRDEYLDAFDSPAMGQNVQRLNITA